MAAAVLLGCSEPSAPETTVLRLHGTVRDAETEAPIEGAQVVLSWPAGAFGTGSEWAETDALGTYDIERDFGGTPFPCDGFGVSAQAAGYDPQVVEAGGIECVPDVQTFDFALAPHG